jgi:hypothetical protein
MPELSNIDTILFILIGLLVLILFYLNINKIFSGFQNNTNESDLDENGFIKNELKPSYWYNYAASEIRSKCFACDAEGKYLHPSNCIDCEMKGGRPIDKLLNRVLTR